MAVKSTHGMVFETRIPVAVIGGGACGMVAALAARDAGAEVVMFERDAVPAGSTALSSGMVPACCTRAQRARGVGDSVGLMAHDIQRKARGQADAQLVQTVCRESGPTVDWLSDVHGLGLGLVEGFLYPGHSRMRMHAPPSRSGAELIGALTAASARAGIDVVTEAQVVDLYASSAGAVHGLRIQRPDDSAETLGCETLVLACNGFGGNPDMVRRHLPDLADAPYFGHRGNQGDAVLWGQAVGAATRHLGAFQGHGSVAQPHGMLISWALMMEGGIQINREGRRFSNEHEGYSEQGRRVLAQTSAVAWNVYDARLHALGQDFPDYRAAVSAGAVHQAASAGELARVTGVPEAALTGTLTEVIELAAGRGTDRFRRDFTTKPPLQPPYYAVRVTGALFHTQGGLVVDGDARVLRDDGTPLPNLFAGGGAACGVSGPSDWGYLSGNGLLTALVLGRLAGAAAARQNERSALRGR